MSTRRSTTIVKAAAAAAVIAAMALAANAIAGGAGSTTSATAAPQFRGAPGQMPPGMGTPIAGSTLTKLTSVATAKYPGTVERAIKLPDGSYVLHVIKSDGSEVHVLLSKAFRITGTQAGGPGGPPPAAAGQTAAGVTD